MQKDIGANNRRLTKLEKAAAAFTQCGGMMFRCELSHATAVFEKRLKAALSSASRYRRTVRPCSGLTCTNWEPAFGNCNSEL
jgi:hypothetical protein